MVPGALCSDRTNPHSEGESMNRLLSQHTGRLRPLLGSFALVAPLSLGLASFFFLKARWYQVRQPAIIDIVAQFPGASAEEVERQVTIPLEVTLAGLPGLRGVRTQS